MTVSEQVTVGTGHRLSDAERAGLRRAVLAQLGQVPDGVKRITIGVDVHRAGVYYVIRGWGLKAESWILDHGYLDKEAYKRG